MKKKIKSLVIAASVAAIAGIGAVSFAAWSGSETNKVEESVESGTVVAVGFADGTAIADNTKKLMPFDQVSIDSDTQTYYYKATLITTGTDFTGYKITVKATAGTDSAIPSGLKVALLENDPTLGEDAELPSEGVTWLDLSDGTAKDLVASGLADDQTYYAYVVLDSDNTTYSTNAGKSFKVAFELTK